MMTLTPAYGRDYKSCKAATKDYLAGKDFIINDMYSRWDGKPVSGDQIPNEEVKLRFANNRKVCLATYKKKGRNEQMSYSKKEIKDLLSEKAQEAIEEIINEGLGKGKLKYRYHATGGRTKRRVGQSIGQKMKNSGGRNERKRKLSAKKAMRTKRKKHGKIVTTRQKKKMKRAMRKRGNV